MAVVESLVTGIDGLVCSANIHVCTKNGVTNRPVVKLFPSRCVIAEVFESSTVKVTKKTMTQQR